jgi:hypothetical protein
MASNENLASGVDNKTVSAATAQNDLLTDFEDNSSVDSDERLLVRIT